MMRAMLHARPCRLGAVRVPLRSGLVRPGALGPELRRWSSSSEDDKPRDSPTPSGPLARFVSFFDRERSVAPEGYNRWKMVPASFLVQLSIGSVYAWSTFNEPLTRNVGVVASAADDWALTEVVPIFSSCAFALGVATFSLGGWAERAGPRKVAATAAACWSGGLALAGVGVLTHTLPLVYLGYGLFGGIGWGLGYISPVSTLLKWLPDRRGLATGLALTAFGGGAMVATPLNEWLLRRFRELPTYLGSAADVHTHTEGGRRFVEVAGEMREALVASASDVAHMQGAAEGVYLVGTGSGGVAATFLALSSIHFAAMMSGALLMRVPREGWTPEGWTPPPQVVAGVSPSTSTGANVCANANAPPAEVVMNAVQSMRTPQFYALWLAVFGNAVAGVSVISCAKTIMNDCFGRALPTIVDGAFAASYVAALSAANMLGRLGWATASDALGRKNTYYLFGLGIPVAVAVPAMTGAVVSNPTLWPLVAFTGSTALVVSFYGGLFSVLPAYIADAFGSKHVGAIHGRLLTAWSASALVGPTLLSRLRQRSYDEAAAELAARVDPARFEETFGEPVQQLEELLAAKTVTLQRLLEIAPVGTLDPTPSLYNTTMYSMAGLMAVALAANSTMKHVTEAQAEAAARAVGKEEEKR